MIRSFNLIGSVRINNKNASYLSASSFSTRKKRTFQNRFGAGNNNQEEDIPQFAGLLRQFYKQSHPDLLRASHTEYADLNDQSWQMLNGILSTIKEVNSYPPRMSKVIPFYMKSKEEPTGLKKVELRLRTGGGDCKKQFTVTLQDFFVESGISADGKFVWGKEYFPSEMFGAKEEEEEL